jgi:hypothetical protein
MRKKLIKILVFIFILVAFDQVAGYMLRKMFFNQKSGNDFSLTYSFFHCNADLLIFGDSRAKHHYDTRVFADTLKMSCFNSGIGGHSILLTYAKIAVMLKRYSPKIIIIELHPASFEYNASNFERLSILLPYYHILPQLRSLILLRNPFERFKLLSGIYPFNSNVISIIRFNIINFVNPFTQRPRIDFNGYVPLANTQMKRTTSDLNSKKALSAIIDTAVIDKNLLNALKSIIHLCRKKSIHLIFVNSPFFHNPGDQPAPLSKTAKQVLSLIHHEKTEFYDFNFEPTFVGRLDLFADEAHLNEKGAAIFTQFLIKKTNLGDKLGL